MNLFGLLKLEKEENEFQPPNECLIYCTYLPSLVVDLVAAYVDRIDYDSVQDLAVALVDILHASEDDSNLDADHAAFLQVDLDTAIKLCFVIKMVERTLI